MELGKNIYTLRKEKGYSQENLAEKVNVTRQTISNWELGETFPNPEQLILLSGALDKSIDELVGNDLKYNFKEECGDNTKTMKKRKVYIGLVFLCGTIAVIWFLSANIFRYEEMIRIIVAGLTIGFFLATACQVILSPENLKK
ncbi:MAG: helix-turn-helix transcriptional regulator [Lachnospiraceae bacterium]|nr:helix-turn-helix transcriptional regulator [Lachnospiraceae bacterium]